MLDAIEIHKLYSLHYFEYMSDFTFDGESHDFWEFVYVDKGSIEVTADQRTFALNAGQIFFHKPNEFHSLRSIGSTAPTLIVISFACVSPPIAFFRDYLTTLSSGQAALLKKIISEAKKALASELYDPYLTKLQWKDAPDFGSQTLIKLYLESFLLLLVRSGLPSGKVAETAESGVPKSDLYLQIIHYLDVHIREHLTVNQICKDNLLARSQIQKLFQDWHQCGVIDYFSRMKIKKAKALIREKQLNFTQISDFLGYSSIYYFSRQFKRMTGMSPSEYSSSVKLLSEFTEEEL